MGLADITECIQDSVNLFVWAYFLFQRTILVSRTHVDLESADQPIAVTNAERKNVKTVIYFFKHNFCVKPYVGLPREPRRNPSNRRLNDMGYSISVSARNRTHNIFCPKREQIPLYATVTATILFTIKTVVGNIEYNRRSLDRPEFFDQPLEDHPDRWSLPCTARTSNLLRPGNVFHQAFVFNFVTYLTIITYNEI